MQKITKEAVFAEYGKTPKRKCFSNDTGLQVRKAKPTFSVAIPSAKQIFEKETGIILKYNPQYNNYWCYINDIEQKNIEVWEQKRGRLIFLRDCLSLSLALDSNFIGEAGKYTEIGQWEHDAKVLQNGEAITALAKTAAQVIQNLPFYKDADYICAVPPAPHKKFDLPRAVVAQISNLVGKPDMTKDFHFGGDKVSVKDVGLAEKWDIWKNADLSFKKDIEGKTIILIDDKYQAGITLQYVAMKLQEAGAREVYGLCFVKTWGDQDNHRW